MTQFLEDNLHTLPQEQVVELYNRAVEERNIDDYDTLSAELKRRNVKHTYGKPIGKPVAPKKLVVIENIDDYEIM